MDLNLAGSARKTRLPMNHPRKEIFSSAKDTFKCIIIQLIRAHALKHWLQMISMIVYVRPTIRCMNMAKSIIIVSLCIASMRSVQLRRENIECSRNTGKHLRDYKTQLKHTASSADRS